MQKTFNSVWDALEDDPAQRANLKLRSKLMMTISDYVDHSGLTQIEAAKQLGITQPRLNDVLKGRIEKCTVDRLVNMLALVGFDVKMSITKQAA